MDTSWTSFNVLPFPSNARKFLTVEELVKVTMFGRRFGSLSAARSCALDFVGMTVS
jgi:hypothetical protein